MGRDLVEDKPMRRKSERHRTSRSQPSCLRIEPLERRSCPAAMLTISLAEPVVLEGEDVTCYVTLTEPARVTERVYLTMANKTATYGSDYFAPTSQQVMFGPGQSRKIVTFSTLRDAGLDKVEGVETFQIIATPVTQSLGTRTVTAMIADYVPLPAISIADAMVVEGSAGTTKTATLTVSLASRYPKPVTVNYVTRDGTATVADGDYVATAGVVTFAPGENSKTVSVTVNGDSRLESDEKFQIVLSGPTNGRLARNAATVTIQNDETDAPGLQIVLVFADSPTYGAVPDALKQLAREAAGRWERIITGDLPGVTGANNTFIDDFEMTVQLGLLGNDPNIPGGTLANARPTQYRSGRAGLPYKGETGLDPTDVSNTGTAAQRQWIVDVITHEMCHALGFGYSYKPFYPWVSGDTFIGPNAVREYNSIFGTSGNSVPLQTQVRSHWDENVFGAELMTPRATSIGTRMYISRVTVGALQDMGYVVDFAKAEPYVKPRTAPTAVVPGTGPVGSLPSAKRPLAIPLMNPPVAFTPAIRLELNGIQAPSGDSNPVVVVVRKSSTTGSAARVALDLTLVSGTSKWN